MTANSNVANIKDKNGYSVLDDTPKSDKSLVAVIQRFMESSHKPPTRETAVRGRARAVRRDTRVAESLSDQREVAEFRGQRASERPPRPPRPVPTRNPRPPRPEGARPPRPVPTRNPRPPRPEGARPPRPVPTSDDRMGAPRGGRQVGGRGRSRGRGGRVNMDDFPELVPVAVEVLPVGWDVVPEGEPGSDW